MKGGGGRRGLKSAEILLAESCRKQVSFESGFKQRKGRRISEAGWQSSRQKVHESWRNALRTFWCCALGLSGASHTMSEGFVLVHMHIESEKDSLVESRQKSGRQKWLSCTVVGISSEASAVLAGVVSHDRIWTF